MSKENLEKKAWKEYQDYVEQNGGKRFPNWWKMKAMPKVYGFGASIVLIGALFKLTHWLPGMWANIMLAVGLGVEAIIFALSSFEKPHIDPDWSKLYSEFNEDYFKVPGQTSQRRVVTNTSNVSSIGQLNMNDEDLDKLRKGIDKLSANASKMAEISDAALATNTYATNMRKAAESVSKLEIQLQSSANLVDTNNKFNKAMSEYIDSAESLKKQMSDLSQRMYQLNKVYGGMLSAMNVKS